MTEASDSSLRILMVCTGNICRSAFAASYLRHRLNAVAPGRFEVSSAGTGWFPGLRVPEEILRIAGPYELDIAEHEGRLITQDIVRGQDLILAATIDHRANVLAQAPAALKRTFTVSEFVHLLHTRALHPGADPQRWRAAIREAATYRAGVTGVDVSDPYGRRLDAYEEMRSQLVPMLDAVADAAS